MYNFCYNFSTSHYLKSLYLVFGHFFQLLLLCDYTGSQAITGIKNCGFNHSLSVQYYTCELGIFVSSPSFIT